MDTDKNTHLQQAIAAIQKKWGNDVIRQAHQQGIPPILPTGFFHLDNALRGGIPRGRVTEITGAPTSGIHTLVLQTVASAQKAGDLAVYMDIGHTFDPGRAARSQVNVAELLLVQPLSVVEAFDILFDLVVSRLLGVIVLDLFLDLIPQHQQTLVTVINRLHPALTQSSCALLILTPSFRNRANVISHVALQLRVTRVGWIYAGRDVCGCQTQVTILKGNAVPSSHPIPIQIIFDDTLAGGEE